MPANMMPRSALALALLLSAVLSGLGAASAQATGILSKPAQQVKENRISAKNAVLLLLDHQTGLFQLVRDSSVTDFKTNVLALAATAKLYGVPTILTTSLEGGPNGPILPEIRAIFPNATLIPRPGEINAWDNTDFVKAATGRKKLLIAGIVTDVCVLFPTLSALAEGYEVYIVTDASGTFSAPVRDAALARATGAGAVLINWFAVACELQRDWRLGPNSGLGLAKLLSVYLPEYGNLISSHSAAVAVGKTSG
ncbi:isochorismatase hydrolase [Monoraphidium neglectum]|uniref:Isochorismatase hydrolase n=1 Tax=Monoraphidium neglectum TaxID=145388 RepID=A0A0D2M6N8_9CHLO|nr:isochorismatase hydrolase [Monoraphidium neglectum]KIY99059.1 isochorismatase hydrolase [Monoraphidium neglectum]|eukprot:XP_013898079.1 isochorismatase hydrolase [Monoraphidium neglectum]